LTPNHTLQRTRGKRRAAERERLGVKVDTVRLPDPLFAIINPTVRLLLRSPLHFLWSRNLMLITFTGRKNGRTFTTPVRYLKTDNEIRCFTSAENKWWRNLRGGANINLLVRGQCICCYARPVADEPTVRSALSDFLSRFPQDSPYYGIRLDRQKKPLAIDLDRASRETIMVVATMQ
jgi:hypothetical protein